MFHGALEHEVVRKKTQVAGEEQIIGALASIVVAMWIPGIAALVRIAPISLGNWSIVAAVAMAKCDLARERRVTQSPILALPLYPASSTSNVFAFTGEPAGVRLLLELARRLDRC